MAIPQFEAFWFGRTATLPCSVFRVIFSLILIRDAVFRIFVAKEFYSDTGVVTRAIAYAENVPLSKYTLMSYFGTAAEASLFFGCWILIGIALLVGYRTRLMTILNFLWVVSIHTRNPWILDGSDDVMIVLSFWCIFLPLGDYWSMSRTNRVSADAYALPLRLVQLQIASIYLFTALYKLIGDTWATGDALYYALSLESFSTPIGDWFLGIAPNILLQGLTYFVLFAELLFFPLVFLPRLQPFAKYFALGSMTLIHLGIASTMAIPNFSIIMITSYLLFLSESEIRRLLIFLPKTLRPASIGYASQAPASYPYCGTPILLSILLSFILAMCLFVNVLAIKEWRVFVPSFLQHLAPEVIAYLWIPQRWMMFAPNPRPTEGWIVISVVNSEGQTHHLPTDGVHLSAMPPRNFGPNARWIKIEENLGLDRIPNVARDWTMRLCEYERARSPIQPLTVSIDLHYRNIAPPGSDRLPNQSRNVISTSCSTASRGASRAE